MKISLTRTQREEIFEKLDIVSDDEHLQAFYKVTEEEVRVLKNVFLDHRMPALVVEFKDKYVELIVSELENVVEIADYNIATGDGESRSAWIGYKRSMLNAIKKLRS